MNRTVFTVGGRYSFVSWNERNRVALEAIKQGHEVKYGVSELGLYYFEIINPFFTEEKHG